METRGAEARRLERDGDICSYFVGEGVSPLRVDSKWCTELRESNFLVRVQDSLANRSSHRGTRQLARVCRLDPIGAAGM